MRRGTTVAGNVAEKRKLEAIERKNKERTDFLSAFHEDPWLGYESIEEALAEYKCSTQAEVMARLLNRENVFISGPAGSGKTQLITKFINLIDAEYGEDFEIALTASTGIAATLIGGTTIHSWAGLGISTAPFNPDEIDPMTKRAASKIKYTDVLIIDEISMLPAYLFDKLDQVMRHYRKNDEPFGGIQLVLIGDFLQLPPVDKREPGVNAGFAPMADVWKELTMSYCYMDKTFRASDPKLKEVLSRMSRDLVDDKVRSIVNSRVGIEKDPEKTYTTLFTINKNVDKFNADELAKNTNPVKRFFAKKTGDLKKAEKLIKSHGIPEIIDLKDGATVILTANTTINGTLYANGSIGKIIGFRGKNPLIKFNDGRNAEVGPKAYVLNEKSKTPFRDPLTGKDEFYEIEVAAVHQYPIKLGYAISVHKSQGQSFDAVEVDLTKCFTPGLGYVALSRVRSMDDLIILGINDRAYKVDPTSKKLSNYVKRKALKGREEFIEKMEDYKLLLTSDLYRMMLWKADDSFANKRPKLKF